MRKKLNNLARRIGNLIHDGLGDTLTSEIRIVKENGTRYIVIGKDDKNTCTIDDKNTYTNTYTIIDKDGKVSYGRYGVLKGISL